MKQVLSALLVILGASSAFAIGPLVGGGGTGPSGTYTRCVGQIEGTGPVTFEIRGTAIPTFIDSVLVGGRNQLIAQLSCHRGGAVPSLVGAGELMWSCADYKTPVTNITVQLMRANPSAPIVGSISLTQMYPLPPKLVGTLRCQ